MYKRDVIYSFLLSCLIYLNTFKAGLLYDDETGVVRNPCVVDKRSTLTDVFTSDFWGYPLHMAGSHKSYRPITTLTYRIQVQYMNGDTNDDIHQTHVKPNSMRLHIVNILIFALVSSTFCHVMHTIFPSPRYSAHDKRAIRYAVLFFIVHPVHTEAVANIVGRCELLSSLFMLLSFSTYVNCISNIGYRSSYNNNNNNVESNISGNGASYLIKGIFWYLSSVLLVILAMLSKEQGITGIGIWFIIDLIYFVVEVKNVTIDENHDKKKIKKENNVMKHNNSKTKLNCQSLTSISAYSYTLNVISKHRQLCVYFFSRQIVNLSVLTTIVYFRVQMNTHLPVFSELENPIAMEENPYTRVLSYSYINACNWIFFVFPWNLTIDWSAGYPLELITSLFDGRLMLPLFSILLFLLLFIDIFFCAKIFISNMETRLYYLFGLSLLIITFIPSSNLFFPVGFIWAERVLFAPSLGFAIIYGHFTSNVNYIFMNHDQNPTSNRSDKDKKISYHLKLNILPITILLLFAIRTITRNNDWESDIKLYSSAVRTLPLNPRNHHGVATYYSRHRDRLDKAEEHFLKAIELYDKYGESMNSLALLYENTNRTEEALAMYRKAIIANPGLHRPFINLGGLLERASRSLLYKGRNNNTYNYNDVAYEYLVESEKVFMEATRLPTVITDRRYNTLVRLGVIRLRLGNFIKAAEAFKQAIAVKGVTDVTALNILATMHIAAGRFDLGIEMLNRVIDKSIKTAQHLKGNEIYNTALSNLKMINENGNEYFQREVKKSFCKRMLPSVRRRVERMPSNGIMEENLIAMKNVVLLVFEDEDLRDVTLKFCKNNLFASDQCEVLIHNLELERNKLEIEANGKPLGEVRYNIVLDNRESLKFSIDGEEIMLSIEPTDDPISITKELCKKHSMKQEDCYVLQQAVENKRDSSIANIKERFDRNPFNIQMDICKEQILAEAQYLFRYLEDVNTHENVNAMEKRQKLKEYGNVTLGALGLLYYKEGKRLANNEQKYELARIYIRYGIFYSAFLIADIGADESKSRIGIDFGKMIPDALSINNYLKKHVNPSSVWKEAKMLDSIKTAPKPDRVAIVSLCQYDPSKTSLGMLSVHNKMVYRNLYGYPLYVESSTPDQSRPIAWGKIKIMQKYLKIAKEQGTLDWIVWVDCDSFFMNMKLKLHLLLSNKMTDNKDLILSEDGMMLNTGFFAIRTSSSWVELFLNDIYHDHDNSKQEEMIFTWHPWWEQASAMFLLHHMDPNIKKKYVKYYPQRVFNSYPKEYSNAVHDHFVKREHLMDVENEEDIDFVIAFSGCKTYISNEECNNLYEIYAKLAEQF